MDGGRATEWVVCEHACFFLSNGFLSNFLSAAALFQLITGLRVMSFWGGPNVLARRDEVSERIQVAPCFTGAKVCMDERDDFDKIVNHGELGVGHFHHVELGGNGMCDVGIKIGEALEVTPPVTPRYAANCAPLAPLCLSATVTAFKSWIARNAGLRFECTADALAGWWTGHSSHSTTVCQTKKRRFSVGQKEGGPSFLFRSIRRWSSPTMKQFKHFRRPVEPALR